MPLLRHALRASSAVRFGIPAFAVRAPPARKLSAV